jgi:hypothetical protein
LASLRKRRHDETTVNDPPGLRRERPVTAEPGRAISVMNPWAWRIVAGLQVVVERSWKPSWRGVLWIHASTDRDPSAPAELWPPAGQLVTSAIIGHVTLADVQGRPGAWRWVLTDPLRLAEPVTGVRGHPGLWLVDLPSRLSAGGNAPGRSRPSHPVRKQHGSLLLSNHCVWQAGYDHQ